MVAGLGEFVEFGRQCQSFPIDRNLLSPWKTIKATCEDMGRTRTENSAVGSMVVR